MAIPGESKITRNIAPLLLRASFRPESVDEKKRTVEIVWTTGARVLRRSWDGGFFEELSLDPKHVRMDRLKSGRAPFLDSHDSYSLNSVLGVIESAKLDGKQGTAVVRFAKAEDDAEADKIFRKVADGILTNVSVGYRVHRFEKVEDGEAKVPVMRATDWEPYEVSLVGMGADAGSGVRSADGGEAMPCEFVITTREEDTMTEEEKAKAAAEEATRKAEAAAKAAAADATRAAAEAATKAERERCAEIRKVVRRAKLGDELADDLIGRGVNIDQARAAVLEKLAAEDDKNPTTQHVRIEQGEADEQKFARGVVTSILERAMALEQVRQAQKTAVGAERLRDVGTDGGEFRGMTLSDLARECLERRGVKTRGLNRERIFAEALSRRGMNSTSDFPVLLESAMNKVLLAAFATQPDSWRAFCAKKTVADFRALPMYRNGSFGTLDAVNEHGEFKNKAIPDGEKSTIKVGTKGNIIAITRQALVNDDLGAFTDLATRFGRAAALSIEADVYALLALNGGLGPTQADAQPLFHANRKNVGTAGAITVETLDADAVLLASQKDPSGNEFLDLQPSILVLPRGLKGTAEVINKAQFDPDTANKLQRPNKALGLFQTIVGTPRLTGTRRYIFADPAIAPVIAVAFLNGQEVPELFSEDGWRVDGTELKVRIDYGVGATDYRGAVTNAGTP